MRKKVGLIINPIAGLGGKAGFKGSDCIMHQIQALENGYEKCSARRVEECLRQITGFENEVLFLAPAGEMGVSTLENSGFPYREVYVPNEGTSSSDTAACLRIFLESDVDLILFCGGDGTARDVYNTIGLAKPVLGIPAGVKMYSACFAVNPLAAGQLLKDFLLGKTLKQELREVMDIDESILGQPGISPRLYGYLSMLNEKQRLQGPKEASTASPAETEILADFWVSQADPDILYLIGPGSTTFQIKLRLCGNGTLIGVDAIKNGRLLIKDADEHAILKLLAIHPQAEIIVTCIGGAGFVFGRGNQQFSPEVIRRVTKENIRLAVTKSKLAGLKSRPMLVDTGDSQTDDYLSGYYNISFHENESTFYRVEHCR